MYGEEPRAKLEALIDERFDSRGEFYSRLATVEEREVKAGRRSAPTRQKTAGHDYWRGVTRQILRGDRNLGPVVGPLFAKAFSMRLEEFAKALGIGEDEIKRPPRVARKDLEHELEAVKARLRTIENTLSGLRAVIDAPTPPMDVRTAPVDDEFARRVAGLISEELRAGEKSRKPSARGRRSH